MALILNIDTSGSIASVSVARDGIILSMMSNENQVDHAAFIHPAINSILATAEKKISELDTIAVNAGPGSYTGIRVGMATAKGLCLALAKPLITINSLELMAKAVIIKYSENREYLFCPMIDARRMEVFTALYDHSLIPVIKPCAMILDDHSFKDIGENISILSFGSGAEKWKRVVKLRNWSFIENVNVVTALALMSYERYLTKAFTELVYSEPVYLKEFYNGI